jgi:PIN domain nuclease of toxin-antitoxin system
VTYLDTHVAVWLYLPRLDLLSDPARERLEQGELRVSPMAVLELEFLREIGRLRVGANAVVDSLAEQLGLEVCAVDFPTVAWSAVAQSWTRDPFDRVIVGHAAAAREPLVTRDETIRQNYADAIW